MYTDMDMGQLFLILTLEQCSLNRGTLIPSEIQTLPLEVTLWHKT